MMSLASAESHKLVCHPKTPSRNVGAIYVRVANTANNSLALNFLLQGDLAGLRIPEQRTRRRTDGLWRHTCFEAFLMADDGPDYREYNFSPSGEWAAYAFRDYRQANSDRQAVAAMNMTAPVIHQQRDPEQLVLEAEIPVELPALTRSMRLGLCAVMEAADGGLSYWALQHSPDKPDFHHLDGFALQLEWC